MGNGASNTNGKRKSNRAEQLPCLKIAILGDSGVGKSSLLVRYLHNQFSPLYTPTNKVAIENIVKKLSIPDHILVSITFWDIPGREEFDLYKSYFTDLDAAIVVVDVSDPQSLQMALVWKQLILNNMTLTSVLDDTPGVKRGSHIYLKQISPDKQSLPILLVGTKLDIVEQKLQSSLDNKINRKNLSCIKELEEYGSKHNFVGSVAASARDGDGSVHQAFQTFIRHIIEKYYRPRKPELNSKQMAIAASNTKEKIFEPCEFDKIDDMFVKGENYVRRIQSLLKYNDNALKLFFNKCIKANLTEKDDVSLETCVIALKKFFCSPDTSLEVEDDRQFSTLVVKSGKSNIKMAVCYEKLLKVFNMEYAESMKIILSEFPDLDTSLRTLDMRVAALCCTEYQDAQTSIKDNVIDYNHASAVIEKNRAIIRFHQKQMADRIKTAEQSMIRIKTAFLW